MRRLRVARAGVAVAIVATATAATAIGASRVDQTSAARATTWLTRQAYTTMPAGQQADIITSRRIAGAPPASLRTALARLAPRAAAYATTPGATAKIVMAQRAAGTSGALGGRNFLASLERQGQGGRYGSTAFDQCLSMMALRVAGRRVPPTAVAVLTAARGDDGWSFSLSPEASPDVDSTAMAVVALRAAGVVASDGRITQALAWLSTQQSGAGWTAYAGSAPSADSTALVARAQVAAGRSAVVGLAFLRAQQQPSGAIANTATVPESRLLATIAAIPPLAGVSLANGFARG